MYGSYIDGGRFQESPKPNSKERKAFMSGFEVTSEVSCSRNIANPQGRLALALQRTKTSAMQGNHSEYPTCR